MGRFNLIVLMEKGSWQTLEAAEGVLHTLVNGGACVSRERRQYPNHCPRFSTPRLNTLGGQEGNV